MSFGLWVRILLPEIQLIDYILEHGFVRKEVQLFEPEKTLEEKYLEMAASTALEQEKKERTELPSSKPGRGHVINRAAEETDAVSEAVAAEPAQEASAQKTELVGVTVAPATNTESVRETVAPAAKTEAVRETVAPAAKTEPDRESAAPAAESTAYTAEDLLALVQAELKADGYLLAPVAKAKVRVFVARAAGQAGVDQEDYVRRLCAEMIRRQVLRLTEDPDLTEEELVTILPEDVEEVAAR